MSDGGPRSRQVQVLILWRPQAYGRELEQGTLCEFPRGQVTLGKDFLTCPAFLAGDHWQCCVTVIGKYPRGTREHIVNWTRGGGNPRKLCTHTDLRVNLRVKVYLEAVFLHSLWRHLRQTCLHAGGPPTPHPPLFFTGPSPRRPGPLRPPLLGSLSGLPLCGENRPPHPHSRV